MFGVGGEGLIFLMQCVHKDAEEWSSGGEGCLDGCQRHLNYCCRSRCPMLFYGECSGKYGNHDFFTGRLE